MRFVNRTFGSLKKDYVFCATQTGSREVSLRDDLEVSESSDSSHRNVRKVVGHSSCG